LNLWIAISRLPRQIGLIEFPGAGRVRGNRHRLRDDLVCIILSRPTNERNYQVCFLIGRRAMYREAFHLLETGVADVETIDRSFRNAMGPWATIAGPFRWMDLTGLPSYARVMSRLLPALSTSSEIPLTLTRLIESGATGVSSGRGFYPYDAAAARRWQALLHQHAWTVRKLS
jgi:hypothetical protein